MCRRNPPRDYAGLHTSVHIDTPSRRRDEARGIYANGAPAVGGQAPEEIVPAAWNRAASFAAKLSPIRTCLTAPGHQRALFAAGSRCESREQATTAQRGPRHWYSPLLACSSRVLCARPCATIKNLPDTVAQAEAALRHAVRAAISGRPGSPILPEGMQDTTANAPGIINTIVRRLAERDEAQWN